MTEDKWIGKHISNTVYIRFTYQRLILFELNYPFHWAPDFVFKSCFIVPTTICTCVPRDQTFTVFGWNFVEVSLPLERPTYLYNVIQVSE